MTTTLRRIPRHVGVIPDGNRRWAESQGRHRREGYRAGVNPALELINLCRQLGVAEMTFYGFTKENVRRPKDQVTAFQQACVDSCRKAAAQGAALLVVGDSRSKAFPDELRTFVDQRTPGDIRVNILVNYGWQWDVSAAWQQPKQRGKSKSACLQVIGSKAISTIDMVVRWGGRQRLSGFLPLQSAYADFYRIDTLWPEMTLDEMMDAMRWYQDQDVTLGG